MANAESRSSSPWMWGVLILVVAAAAFFVVRSFYTSGDPNDPAVLSKDVTLRDAETGFEWKLNRGRMEAYLYEKAANGQLDANLGLENPKTGKRTGFPVDRADWDRTVARILEESKAAAAKRSGGK